MNVEDMDDTGETTLPGQGGDTADKGLEKADGAGAQEAGDEDADELKGKIDPDTQARIDKRIGKLTAKAKTAAEERDALKAELDRIKAEKDAEEAAKFKHLPVHPMYLTAEAKAELAEAEQELAKAEEAEEAWSELARSEEGYKDSKTGKAYTQAQCAAFAKQAARAAGAASARKDLIVKAAQRQQEADLREIQARKAGPKPGAGAPEVPAKPKKIEDKTPGSSGGKAPAIPADIDSGRSPAAVPKDQASAKAWLEE